MFIFIPAKDKIVLKMFQKRVIMKIHLISNMYPCDKQPSYGVFVKNTEEILLEAGFSVDKTVLNKETNKFLKFIKYLMYYLKIFIKGLIKNYDVTYVHYAAHNALILLILKKIKKNMVIITNVHGSDVVPEVPSQEKYQPFVHKLLNTTDVVITPSKYYKELVKSKYNLKNSIKVFPSGGVNKNMFFEIDDKDVIFQKLNIDSQYNYLGYISRLDIGKGWDILLSAMKELKSEEILTRYNLKAIIVGDGKEKEKFLQMVSEFGLENDIIHFPLLPQNELNLIYNIIDVFCFPTTRRGESLGLVGLEAMACGTPVIGSKIGGLLDYIEDGINGYFFEVGSPHDLKDKILQFYSLSSEQKTEMSRKAKVKAMDYEVNNIKGILVNIFGSIKK